jgi:hypothetical protein
MAVYRTGVQRNWGWGASNPNWDSPSVLAGDFGVTVHLQMDGRISIGTPTWDGSLMTVAKDQSGGGGAWTGACKICYMTNPPTGVTSVNVGGSNGASIFIYLFTGINQDGPVVDTDGRYGGGNPNNYCDVDAATGGVDVAVGGCHSQNTGAFLLGGNEGTSRGSRSPVWEEGRSYRFQSSQGDYGTVIHHIYDWDGQYADNCVAAVSFMGIKYPGPQVIWAMSKIYDQIQDNCKKLGIGDFGNFGRGPSGLWKPKSGLVTI